MSPTTHSSHIPRLRFSDFFGEWEEKKLGQVTNSLGGYAFNSNLFTTTGKKLLIPKNFTKNGRAFFTKENTKYTSEEVDEKYICKEGDVVVLLTDLTPSCELLGNPLLLNKSDGEVLLNQRILKLEPTDHLINKFLLYRLLNNSYKEYIKMTCSGSTVRHSSSKIVNDYHFFLPSLPEQTKIGGFLSTVDEKITSLTELKSSRQSYKSGVMQGLFSQEIRFDGFTDEWEERNLGEIAKITTGKLDANAMVENGENRFYTCAREYYRIDNYAFDTEALLISGNGANVGYIHYYKGKFNAYQRTYVLDKFTENITYIKHYLDKFLSSRIGLEKKEGNTPYIVLSTLSEMSVKLPSLPEQEKITNFLTSIDDKISEIDTQIQKAKKWKTGLLQGLFI